MAEVRREEFDEEMERREYRRRRRIRNQIIAYIFAVLMLAALIGGIAFGIHKLITLINDKKQEQELQRQMEEMQNNQEDPGVVEAPQRRSLSSRRKRAISTRLLMPALRKCRWRTK